MPDGPERIAIVVSGEVLHVLEEKHLRAMVLRDLVDLEEKGSARVFEPLLFPGDAESLAGKASAQNVMWRYTVQGFGRPGELGDVSEGYLAEVHEVRATCVLVPFTREDARSHDVLSGHTETSDAGEEVDEGEGGRRLLLERRSNLGESFRDIAFAGFCCELALK